MAVKAVIEGFTLSRDKASFNALEILAIHII
jgi:hypothetical protein